ncbi:peptidase family M48-domain-containing protein [Leucosporidium creatinivorum]|uniref:Peptidase family M48-domain-containing protein n=1 Tax=Leucosporidium creatinivorum TaxID=106004 RepID=A0A1Y2G2H3_9BASI|nr:peptidase family M48-domain-containing protein [Leucosporidium creatinivorum]
MLVPRWIGPPTRLLSIHTSSSLPRPLIAPQSLRSSPFNSLRSSPTLVSPFKASTLHSQAAVGSLTAASRPAVSSFPLSSPTRDAGGRRGFSSSARRQDVFFVSVPAFKQGLLVLVRVGLILLPVAWRWGFFRRFPKQAGRLWQLPLLAVLAVIGLGLNQSPRTARWRLLLMSEREELEWSNKKFDEIIMTEEHLLLPPDDPRVAVVKRVCDRLVQTLNDDSPLSCFSYAEMDQTREYQRRKIVPSARTEAAMLWMPETSNPQKRVQRSDWDIFVVDLPKINGFVLPSTDIFLYTGLLSVVEDDENLLAAVLAHEIAHCTERHVTEAMGFMALSGVVFDILRGTAWALTLSFPMIGDLLSAGFTFIDRRVGQRAYSRKLETEADALGLELMAKAGFDPRGAVTLWEILTEVENDVTTTGEHGTITDHIALLRTHPTGEQRLEDLKRHLPQALKLYDKARKEKAAVEAVKSTIKELAAQGESGYKAEQEGRGGTPAGLAGEVV